MSAKKIFVANAGGEVNANAYAESETFSGGPGRAYNQLYAVLKSNAAFEFARTPAEADVVVEMRFVAPYVRPNGHYSSDPQIRLAVRDPKTRTPLWAITEHIEMALLQRNRDKNFDAAIQDVVERLLALRAGP